MNSQSSEKIMFIFGTRPEAIKMVPVINKFFEKRIFQPIIIVTAQHREMLDQALNVFNIIPDYDLGIMKDSQTLEDITVAAMTELSKIIKKEKPKMIIVQGDTTSTFVGALSGYYNKISVGHIEAGLRTFDKFQPYPEEINRKLTSCLTDLHFAPTKSSRDNLLKEGISQESIFVTGNTVIDTLFAAIEKKYIFKEPLLSLVNQSDKKLILVTAHRRENFGQPLKNILKAFNQIIAVHKNTHILFPVHPNPNVRKKVYEGINSNSRIHLVDPMDYESFIHVMNAVDLILTDSGGVQEEAPSLGKPVLVLRNKTERPEAVEAGTVKLVGSDFNKIVSETSKLLTNEKEYNDMARAINPYGDGKSSERIHKIVENYFDKTNKKI